MCDRCANIDYAIADPIWLPCGGSVDRYTSRDRVGVLPPVTPTWSPSDQDYDSQTKIHDLMAIIRKQRTEIAVLKAKIEKPPTDSHESFEGI
jgi:hypothetical protein